MIAVLILSLVNLELSSSSNQHFPLPRVFNPQGRTWRAIKSCFHSLRVLRLIISSWVSTSLQSVQCSIRQCHVLMPSMQDKHPIPIISCFLLPIRRTYSVSRKPRSQRQIRTTTVAETQTRRTLQSSGELLFYKSKCESYN